MNKDYLDYSSTLNVGNMKSRKLFLDQSMNEIDVYRDSTHCTTINSPSQTTFTLANHRKSSLSTIVPPLDSDVYVKPKLLETGIAS